jgi:hypothetical protein
MDDYKLWISIYAAVISTVVFAWRLYEFYYDRIGKLNVSVKTTFRTNVYGDGNIGNTESFLVVSIVNIGKNKRFIEQPRFQSNANYEENKYLNLVRTDIIKTYPICLEPGEKFDYDLPYDKIGEDLKKAGVKKIKARVYDTHGKVYRSKWFEL